MKNPVCVDDKSCKEGMTQDWQPDAIEDGSIEEAKDCSRIKHTLQLTNVSSKDYPEASISLSRFRFEDILESQAPEHVRTSCRTGVIVGDREHCWEVRSHF
jgi:hypothetical protein